ncbi:MAG: S9 family peptidase [Bacillota bacterium]
MEEQKRPVTSRDLWSLRFTGDPELSPSGNELVWVETWINAQKNRYESALFISRRDAKGVFSPPSRLTYGRRSDGDGAMDRSPRFSPDGSLLAFTSNRSGRGQIWLLDMKEGGEARQLTTLEDGVSQITWSPDGKRIAFCSREPKPKRENPPDGFETDKDVTVITRLRYKANGVPGVVDPRPVHIYTVEVDTGEVRQVTDGDYHDMSPAFSPDGSTIAFISSREPDRELRMMPDLWTIPVGGGEAKKLTSGKGPVYGPEYSPDGKWIAVVGHENGEVSTSNQEIMVIPSEGGEMRHLWDIDRSVGSGLGSDCRSDAGRSGPYWSSDSRTLYFILTDKRTSGIYRTNLDRPHVELVAGAIPGNINACGKFPPVTNSFVARTLDSGNVLFAFNGNSPVNPGDIYAIEMPGDVCGPTNESCPLQEITRVNESVLSGLAIVEPERFTFNSTDGLELDGWMMKPVNFEEGKKYPAVIEIHGGPHSAYGEAFFHEFQLLASKGFGVFYCNPRGSSGYGKEFADGVIGDWGGMDYQDIMSLKHYADKVPWVDSSRIGVTGGSYGGYMTNWIVGHTDEFRAAVTLRSISNMYTKYGVSDIGWFGNKRGFGGRDLWDSEDFIMERSPIRYAPRVTTPILIIHSEQDYRCPLDQAEQWYVALKRLGKTVEFVKFAGENHELSRSGKPWNRVERLDHIVRWFEKYLKA